MLLNDVQAVNKKSIATNRSVNFEEFEAYLTRKLEEIKSIETKEK